MDSKTIVIAEDEQDLREALVDALTAEGFTVHAGVDGNEAVNLALEHKPDLIMADLKMPVMDGNGLLQALRNDEWGKAVPIIVLTAQSDIVSMSDAVEFGGMNLEYMVKTDWTLENIVAKVKEKIGA